MIEKQTRKLKGRSDRVAVTLILVGTLLFSSLISPPPLSAQQLERSYGQHVYLPVYSYIEVGPRNVRLGLTTILSVRNVDPDRSIRLLAADYYDSAGNRVERHVRSPISIGPLGTYHVQISEADHSGGPGANFVVMWEADPPVIPPLVETVMLGLSSAQGVSFTGESRVIKEIHP
jgi:hypothetical protein